MKKNNNIDATKGNVKTNLWMLAWPIMIGNLIQVIYNMADTYWVGKLNNSTQAIGAVTITFSVVFVLVSLALQTPPDIISPSFQLILSSFQLYSFHFQYSFSISYTPKYLFLFYFTHR